MPGYGTRNNAITSNACQPSIWFLSGWQRADIISEKLDDRVDVGENAKQRRKPAAADAPFLLMRKEKTGRWDAEVEDLERVGGQQSKPQRQN